MVTTIAPEHRFRSALIVEDQPVQARLAEMVVRSLGITRVECAADGVQGARIAAEQQPELVVCDVDMPDGDGMELMRSLAGQRPRPAVVIVSAVEAGLLRTVENLAREQGLLVLAALSKPLDRGVLNELLKSALTDTVSATVAQTTPGTRLSAAQLQEALTHGWFEPWFEAKVGRERGQIEGFELLARLQHPTLGLIGPACFIAELEAAALIDAMTWQILGKAFQTLADIGVAYRFSFNLSPTMLHDDRVVEDLTRLTRRYGVAPERITCELTESAAIESRGLTLERLARLRLRGFGLSIDDFGIGYSTLSQLSSVPFTELKIDRLFSSGAVSDYKARTMVESCLMLADRLRLHSCAEGVETREIFQLLHDLGTHSFQGYLFHRPMPAEEFFDWAREWNRRDRIRQLYLGVV
jgi:EAL domain-containing protein (putative c-di-GMP-specific phosphodiesterase class I)